MEWQWIIVGVLLGSAGWLLYLGGMPLIGAVAGGGFGASLGFVASGLFATAATPWIVGGAAILGGACGLMLVRALQMYIFFILGASLGSATLWYLLDVVPVAQSGWLTDPVVRGVLLLVFAVVGGLTLIRLRRFVLAVVTSFAGALIFSMGLPPHAQAWGGFTALVIFLAIQCGLVQRFVDNERFDAKSRKLREDTVDVYEED